MAGIIAKNEKDYKKTVDVFVQIINNEIYK